MLSFSFPKLLILVSSCAYACAQAFVPGTYHIQNAQTGDYARNLPVSENVVTFGQIGPPIVQFIRWNVESVPTGWTFTNAGSDNRVYVPNEIKGAVVQASSEEETAFAVEAAGDGTWVIKAVNSDLLWTVADTEGSIVPTLERANGGEGQRFVFNRA